MIKRSAIVIVVAVFFLSFTSAIPDDAPIGIATIPDDTPISIFIDDVVNIVNATPSWAVELYNQNLTGAGQTICIIDTGINFTHPDLLGKNLTCNIDCFAKDCIENCSISDDNGHGTHVAGIAAANGTKKGIAPDANLIGIKALDSNGNGQISYMANGIIWCTDNSETYNITTISMSLGTGPPDLYSSYCDIGNPTTANAINAAIAKNISVIAATGNNGANDSINLIGNTTHISLPACIENATAVSATNDDDGIASYANYNSITDLFAPGTSVSSLDYQTSGYTPKSGTSMSTPAVAGAFALINQLRLLQTNEKPTPSFIQNILTTIGETIASGFKRINILASIEELVKPNVTLISPANDTETYTQTNFTCNTTSPSNYTIQNVTFYIWNSTDTIYQETNTTPTNETIFNYSLDVDFYNWNCLATDEKNYQSWATSNNTINFTEVQAISLLSPARNEIITSSNDVTFTFNTSMNASNCSLIIDYVIAQTTLNITDYSFTKTLANGDYDWSINCTSNESLTNSSSTRSLTIDYTEASDPPSPGGGGGSSSPSNEEYIIPEEELKNGTTKELRTDDLISINVRNIEHTITVDKIKANSAILLIKSSPQYIELTIGETKKVSFEENYYNLKLTLNEIKYGKINISLQEIHELKDSAPIMALQSDIEEDKPEENEIITEQPPEEKNELEYIWDALKIAAITISVILGILIIIYFLLKEHEDEE